MHKNRAENFAGQKRTKTAKRTRKSPKKAKPGAFWVLERGSSGWWQMKPGEKTRSPNQSEHYNHATRAKRKPAETQSFRRFCGRGRRTCLGCRLGRFAAERHWRSLTPRHALRRAQPCLVAESLCALTKNREASIVLASLFLAGAEGLEPSARGFGVDVETQQREQERGSVDGFSRRSHKRVVLVWCCKGFSRSECSQKTG